MFEFARIAQDESLKCVARILAAVIIKLAVRR